MFLLAKLNFKGCYFKQNNDPFNNIILKCMNNKLIIVKLFMNTV